MYALFLSMSLFFFFSSRRRHTRFDCDWSSDVCSSDLSGHGPIPTPAIIVLDGLGIGPCPDQAAYGDLGSDTLGNVARAVGGLRLPNLERLGLGLCRPILGLTPGFDPGLAPGVSRAQRRLSDPGRKRR